MEAKSIVHYMICIRDIKVLNNYYKSIKKKDELYKIFSYFNFHVIPLYHTIRNQ